MKSINKFYLVIGLFLIILCAYFIPDIVSKFEDMSLQSREEHFMLNDVDISSEQVSVINRLVDFPNIMAGEVVTQNDTPEETENFNIVKSKIDEFLKLLTFNNRSIKEYDAIFLVIANQNRTSNTSFYPIWKFEVVDDVNETYTFWFDETTGKVMAFQIESTYIFHERNTEEQFAKLTDYYGFYRNERYEQHGETYLRFIEGKTIRAMVEIPYVNQKNKFYFNMMPF